MSENKDVSQTLERRRFSWSRKALGGFTFALVYYFGHRWLDPHWHMSADEAMTFSLISVIAFPVVHALLDYAQFREREWRTRRARSAANLTQHCP